MMLEPISCPIDHSFLMTFIDTDAESTYIDSTKKRKKIKGQKGEDEEEATQLIAIYYNIMWKKN